MAADKNIGAMVLLLVCGM
ncbi:unnamed protein product [Prunus armeniaca]